jgi:hypothetical protein
MRRQLMMVLASAALAGSLLATDAQARGGGGHGGSFGHIGARIGGFRGARTGGVDQSHIGDFGRVRIGAYVGGLRGALTGGVDQGRIGGFGRAGTEGFTRGNMAGIRRGYLGRGTGIHRGHVAVLAAPAFG